LCPMVSFGISNAGLLGSTTVSEAVHE